MLAIAELARTVDDFRPLGETAELICERVVLITGSDLATIYLAQDESLDGAVFQMWGSSGIRPEYLLWARGAHPAPTRAWAPVMLSSDSGQPRLVSDVFQRPDLHLLWEGARVQGYRGLGVMPIVARGHVLGTLNTYWHEAHQHATSEVALLQTAARLAGVALETAMIAERHRDATAETLRRSGQFEMANSELFELSQAQVELAEQLAGSPGDPAEAVCYFLAARLGSGVMLCNPDGKPRAYAGPKEARTVLGAVLARRDMGRAARAVSFETPAGHVYRVGKEQVLGYLVVGTQAGKPRDVETVVIRHALALLAFELQSERTDRSLRVIARPGMLHTLVRGHLTPYLARETAQILEMTGQPCRMIHLAIPDDAAALAAGRRLNRLPSNSDFLAASADCEGLMILVQDRGRDHLRRSIPQILDGAGQSGGTGGVSALFTDPCAIPGALDQARAAARSSAAGAVTIFEDLGITGELLAHVGGEGAADFVQRLLGSLVKSDEKRGTGLVASLDSYLRHRGSLRDAAAELGIHPNTLQLRLTRSARLTGMDLHDPRQLGLLSVALGWRALLPTV